MLMIKMTLKMLIMVNATEVEVVDSGDKGDDDTTITMKMTITMKRP